MKYLVLLIWAAVGSLVVGQVGTEEFDPLGEHSDLPKMVRVQVEFVKMPHEVLTKVLSSPAGVKQGAELREEVAKLMEAGKAEILETMVVLARSGQRATAESVQEYIYPTEWEPAYPASTKEGKDAEGALFMPTATAFETRNLGATLEVEPTLGASGRIIDLRLVPEVVYLVGESEWGEWNTEVSRGAVTMPKIYVLRLNTATVLLDGVPQMLGVLSPKDDDGNLDHRLKLMVFVKADVLTLGGRTKKSK